MKEFLKEESIIGTLQGNFQPINEIGEAVLLKDVQGNVPADFPEGVYIRNGYIPPSANLLCLN